MKGMQRFAGLDVHKDTIVIAVADEGRDGEVRAYGTISSDWHAMERALTKLRADGAELHIAYEAGPTGFVLYRQLHRLKIDCIVVAPSKMPVPGGRRQKTDRRDAELLARLLRAGELTAIHVPDEIDESIRDLACTRSDAVDDLTRAKQRLKSFLLRVGYLIPRFYVYHGSPGFQGYRFQFSSASSCNPRLNSSFRPARGITGPPIGQLCCSA